MSLVRPSAQSSSYEGSHTEFGMMFFLKEYILVFPVIKKKVAYIFKTRHESQMYVLQLKAEKLR